MKMMFLPASVLALAGASCAPSTPETRIAAQPALFQSLPARHQELVRQGSIDRGMSTDAVSLAWGRPSRQFEGSDGQVATLRWEYTGTTPVYSNSHFGGFGTGRHGRWGRGSFYGSGIGQEVTFVPYRRATVLFREGRVSSWERIR
jgi:hypothetical protein